jgi:hypothetical protein
MKANLGNLGKQVKGTEFKSHSFALGLWFDQFKMGIPMTLSQLSVLKLSYQLPNQNFGFNI